MEGFAHRCCCCVLLAYTGYTGWQQRQGVRAHPASAPPGSWVRPSGGPPACFQKPAWVARSWTLQEGRAAAVMRPLCWCITNRAQAAARPTNKQTSSRRSCSCLGAGVQVMVVTVAPEAALLLRPLWAAAAAAADLITCCCSLLVWLQGEAAQQEADRHPQAS